jgi:hypothetical protein
MRDGGQVFFSVAVAGFGCCVLENGRVKILYLA